MPLDNIKDRQNNQSRHQISTIDSNRKGFDSALPKNIRDKESSQCQNPDHTMDSSRNAFAPALPDNIGSEHSLAMSDESDPKAWRIMSLKVLKNLVAEARGEATKKVIEYIKNHLGKTKLIFVVGQSGSGKTLLLKELTGINLKEGSGTRSGTLFHHLCPAIIHDEQYIFVDTAGFGAADLDNNSNFSDIVGCLNGLGPFVDVAGLLFVYGGDQARMTNDDLRTLQWVQCFCGPKFYRNVVFVTTKWDVPRPKPFEAAWTRIEELLRAPEVTALCNPPTRHVGAAIYHHGLPGGVGDIEGHKYVLDKDADSEKRSTELKSLILRNFKHAPIFRLQVAQEMGPKGDWTKTEAAKVLASDPQSITVEIHADRAVVCPKAATTSTTPPIAPQAGNPNSHDVQKTWYQRLMDWIEAAQAAAAFFKQAREAPETPSSWSSAWEHVQGWWSGTPRT